MVFMLPRFYGNRYIVLFLVAILAGVMVSAGGHAAATTASEALDDVATVAAEAATSASDALGDAAAAAADAFESAKGKAKGAWNDASSKLKKIYDDSIAGGWEATKDKLDEELKKGGAYAHQAREYVNSLLGKTTDPEAAHLRQVALERFEKIIDKSYNNILKHMRGELKKAEGKTAEKDLKSFLGWYLATVRDAVDKTKTALSTSL